MIYDISYRTSIGAKSLRVGETDGTRYNFIMKLCNGTRYLVLFGPKKCNTIYNWIIFFISQKIDIVYGFFHKYAGIKVDSYGCFVFEKTLALQNVTILIKSVFNKDQNDYYYNIFLAKCSYQLAEKMTNDKS